MSCISELRIVNSSEKLCLLMAKFHYAIQAADLVADLVFDLSQTASSYLDMLR